MILSLLLASALATVPADRMIDAAGVTLHVHCDGERAAGMPLVVLEAGAGNGAKTWDKVFEPISKLARVCAYDRPGLGTSPRLAQPQTGSEAVDLLHAWLKAADERPPYVMVGHSYGGAIVRLFAMRWPAEVTGMVLVDSSHEDQQKRFAAVPGAPSARPSPASPRPAPPEKIDLPGISAELAKAPWHANIPLVVLTKTDRPPTGDDPAAAYEAARGRIWLELQAELATRSPQSEHIVAPDSGHYIHNDEPALVIDAVRRVIAKSKKR
jgi:pimeloyl-ACP methyl ester carboxylesterase